VTTETFEKETPTLPLEACIIHSTTNTEENFERRECANYLEATTPMPKYGKQQIEVLGTSISSLTPSMKEAPKLELKDMPTHLRYAYLGENSTLPVIVSSSLTGDEEEKLLRVLRDHKTAIGWTIADIKSISPSVCMHKILMEDIYKTSVQPQRHLNPTMKEVVRKEVLKLRDAGMIYAISDSNLGQFSTSSSKKRRHNSGEK